MAAADVALRRALTAATAYFLALFTLGFVLGTIRVMLVAPRFGEFYATLAEVPVMLTAALIACPWTLRHWKVPRHAGLRWMMVLWFLALLMLFEALLGTVLFGRTVTEQLASLATASGLLGLSAQVIAALLPVLIAKSKT